MLCRALLAAVVLSYVLCVLLLSGVQKEDIDAGTLRKLQRHNVNIDDISDQQLRKQCLGKTDVPVTILTQENPVTEKIITEILSDKDIPVEKDKVGAEDRSKLRKIFEFLKDTGKKKTAMRLKDTSSTLIPAPISKLRLSSPYRSRNRNINVDDASSETSEKRETPVTDKDDEKAKKATMNKKLMNLMNIWQSDIDTVSYSTQQESTTVKVIKDNTMSKNTKEVEYIKKIVEEVMSKKKLNEPQTDFNVTFKVADQTSGAKFKSKTVAPTNYYLNHCKLGNFYTHNQEDKDKYATFDNVEQFISGTNEPVTTANDEGYVICKRLEAKDKTMLTDRTHDNVLNSLLNKLKQESQRIKPDNESVIRTAFDNQPKSKDSNQQNNRVLTSNSYKKGPPDNEIITAFNQSESIISNKQSNDLENRDNYKNGLDLLDPETARALEAVLERQSNIYNQIFSQQRDPVQMRNNDKERIKLFENERRKVLQSVLIANPPTFNYKPSNQDDDIENKEYNKWRFVLDPKENIIINNVPYIKNEKSTNTRNTVKYDPNLGKQLKRPWFYSEVSNGQLRTKNKQKLKGIFFIPNDKMTRTKPDQKTTMSKKWSPYFDTLDKNGSIIGTNENETPKSLQPILVDSYGLIKLNNREISQELTENSKKLPSASGLYHEKYESPNIIKEENREQFETTKVKKINQSHYRTIHETKTCVPDADAEYKSDWRYFKHKQVGKQTLNMKEQNEDSDYFNYHFPSRPRTSKNRYEKYISEKELANRNVTKDSIKLPAFSQNVIKDIANSIREIVLKDLITTKIIPPTTTTPSTSTSTPTTTTTTTTTPSTTITTSTINTTTIKTTEKTSTAETKQPLNQDASKALQKIMEMFEKISSIKEKIFKNDNATYRDVRYDTETEATKQTILNRQEQPIQQKTEYRLAYDQSLQPNLEKQTPYVPQPLQPNPVPYQQQPLQYIPQAVQMKPDNNTLYVLPAMQLRGSNRLPYVPQPSQSNSESRSPYSPLPAQLPAENRSPYDPQNLQSNSENRGPYFPPALQLKAENRIPYVLQPVQMKTENRTPYVPQAVQMKTVNNIARDPYDSQALQGKLDNRTPYFPTASQMRLENRIPYSPQAVQMKTEINLSRDPQTLQGNPQNLTPYFPQSLQQKSENRVPYDSQPLQSNPGNRVPYDQPNNLGINRVPYDSQPLQDNPGNHVPYDQPPLQNNLGINRIPYDSQPLQSNPGNRVPYDQPPLQNSLGINRVPYDPQPLQSNPDNLPQPLQYTSQGLQPKFEQPLQRDTKSPYSNRNPYYNSKIELDPYQDKEVLEPIKQKPKPRKYAITVQTNSGEIAPLKIAVQKPVLQTIVLTPDKSPTTLKERRSSSENFSDRKPKSVATRHQVNTRQEIEISSGDIKPHSSRHVHRDAYVDRPKSRKIKNEREVIQQYKPRSLHHIERFHEKLERGDDWDQYEEEKIAKRVQRPIVKNTNYDDTHFRNFLQTQQKVNAMLERILATSKNKLISTEVV